MTGVIDQAVLPPPSTVLARAAGLVTDGTFLGDAAATLSTWAYSMGIAIVVAIPVGLVLGAIPAVNIATRPLVEFLRPIPSVALIPVALIFFQSDIEMRLAVVVYASVWPVFINTLYGLSGVDPVTKETVRSFGFGWLDVLARVSLPSAAPFIATGVRLAASIALIVAISTDFVSSTGTGIGTFLIDAESGGGRPDLMLATILWAGILGLVINAVFVGAERRMFRWHVARQSLAEAQ